ADADARPEPRKPREAPGSAAPPPPPAGVRRSAAPAGSGGRRPGPAGTTGPPGAARAGRCSHLPGAAAVRPRAEHRRPRRSEPVAPPLRAPGLPAGATGTPGWLQVHASSRQTHAEGHRAAILNGNEPDGGRRGGVPTRQLIGDEPDGDAGDHRTEPTAPDGAAEVDAL